MACCTSGAAWPAMLLVVTMTFERQNNLSTSAGVVGMVPQGAHGWVEHSVAEDSCLGVLEHAERQKLPSELTSECVCGHDHEDPPDSARIRESIASSSVFPVPVGMTISLPPYQQSPSGREPHERHQSEGA